MNWAPNGIFGRRRLSATSSTATGSGNGSSQTGSQVLNGWIGRHRQSQCRQAASNHPQLRMAPSSIHHIYSMDPTRPMTSAAGSSAGNEITGMGDQLLTPADLDRQIVDLCRKYVDQGNLQVLKIQAAQKDGHWFALNSAQLALCRRLEEHGACQMVLVDVVPLNDVPCHVRAMMRLPVPVSLASAVSGTTTTSTTKIGSPNRTVTSSSTRLRSASSHQLSNLPATGSLASVNNGYSCSTSPLYPPSLQPPPPPSSTSTPATVTTTMTTSLSSSSLSSSTALTTTRFGFSLRSKRDSKNQTATTTTASAAVATTTSGTFAWRNHASIRQQFDFDNDGADADERDGDQSATTTVPGHGRPMLDMAKDGELIDRMATGKAESGHDDSDLNDDSESDLSDATSLDCCTGDEPDEDYKHSNASDELECLL